MIEAVKLEKSFGAVKAVRGVSFTVKPGEAVGFLGPNGAGKTTTFRMLAGTIGPSSGTVRVGGYDVQSDPIAAKTQLGYMAENAPLYPELRAAEYLMYRAELKGIGRSARQEAVEKAAASAQITDMLGTQIGHLSKGYRQRTAMADALLGDPPILLFDEPTSGLDPNQVLEVRQLIRTLAKNRAVVLSTHVLSEVEATCSRAIVIHQGRIVGEGTLDELQEKRSKRQARIIVDGDRSAIETCLGEHTGETTRFEQSSETRTVATFDLSSPEALGPIVKSLVQAELTVLEAAPTRAALDEVFAELTQTAELTQNTEGRTTGGTKE